MPRTSEATPAVRASKPKGKSLKRWAKPKVEAAKQPRKTKRSHCQAVSPDAEGWLLCSVWNKKTYIEWGGRSMLEMRPTDARLRAPWEYDESLGGALTGFPASR